MVSSYSDEKTLSPRELARAIGASESSVKRWIDAGRIPAKLTSGGHRRVELMPALRFVRASRREVVDPRMLGLDCPSRQELGEEETLGNRVFELLCAGQDTELSQAVLAALAVNAIQPAALFDGPVRSAMARIGHQWAEGRQGIYVEHRATQVLLRVIDRVDALLEPTSDELIAVGGSISGDPSLLPTRMASTVLASEGISPINLGADLPAEAFLEAADQIGAQIVWVSVSYVSDAPGQSQALAHLAEQLAQRDIACILGGREIHRLQLPDECAARTGSSMQELATLARQLRKLKYGVAPDSSA